MAVSKAGYILTLIGGILELIGGAIYSVIALVVLIGRRAAEAAAGAGIVGVLFLVLAIWFIVVGILLIVSSKKMKKEAECKKGSIMALIFGILGANILAIIGAILGLVEATK